MYTFSSTTSTKSAIAYAIVIIVETNLPLLTVNVPSSLITQKINKNDDISIKIEFDGNPDEVFFSLIIFYKLNVVKTKAFEYIEYSFRIWDLFDSFDTDTSNILLRVSLYDPQYFMPS